MQNNPKKLFVLELTQEQVSLLKSVFENSKELTRITKIVERNPAWNLYFMELFKIGSLISAQSVECDKLYQDIFLQVACQQPFSVDLELSL